MLPDIYSGLILFVLSGLSMIWCQNFAHFLPQALDIVPIAALFMWIGTFIKESVDFDNLTGLNKLVFTGLIIIWAGCFICKIYIELSTRHYPGLYLPIFEAVGGTFVVAFFAKLLPSGKVSEFFQTVGKHTLAVLCIHHLDLYWVIWGDYIQSWPVAVIVRLIVDLVLLALVIRLPRKLKS